jgi:hypothetical protein
MKALEENCTNEHAMIEILAFIAAGAAGGAGTP